MIRTIVLFVLLVLIGFCGQAQVRPYLVIDSLAEVTANQLINNKETNCVLVFKKGTVGSKILREKDCGCEDDGSEVFLIWEKENKPFVRQFGCCIKDEVKPFKNATLFKELIKDQALIFSSEFKTDFDESHYQYWELKLISTKNKQEIEVVDFLFSDDNKYQKYNLSQPVKSFIDKLELELVEK